MQLVPAPDAAALATRAADWVLAHADPPAGLALAVGNSVAGAYAELARRPGCLTGVRAVTIDELYGLPQDDPRLFASWLLRDLGTGTGLTLDPFDPQAEDPDAEARRVAGLASARGLSACVLGLGPNGHLALNEPDDPFDAPDRHVTLRPETVTHLGGADAIAPATSGMTLSLRTLLGARSLLLVVDGAKQPALDALLAGEVTEALPASVLHEHPDVTVMVNTGRLLIP